MASAKLNRPDAALIERMTAIVGEAHALTEPDRMLPYLTEDRGLYRGKTPLILRPGSVDEVAAILRLANEARVGVVPQAGNTGLVGGQIPTGDEIVLLTTRFNKVRKLDGPGLAMTVEAGVTLADAQAAAAGVDRLYPLSLGSEASCRIGGNIASNAGGVNVLVYGNTRALVLGLEVVLADGTLLSDLRPLKKNNAGYDLKQLFIGSEGTLGVVTAASLRLYPRPREIVSALIALKSVEGVCDFFGLAQSHAGPLLTAFEFLPKRALEFISLHTPGAVLTFPLESPWYVLLDLSMPEADGAGERLLERIYQDAEQKGLVEDAQVALEPEQRRRLWRMRESLNEAQKPEGASIKHDVSVPIAAIPELVRRGNEAIERIVPGARPVPFGHFGDGNVHFNISVPKGADNKAFMEKRVEFNRMIHDLTRELGGSFAAEHGIGQLKRSELLEKAGPAALHVMRTIKAALDPNGIMNPGKIL